jgi:enoyl-CoA hydratase/carnithine racemase
MSDILLHLESARLTLTINRPERKNALTYEMYQVLVRALEEAQANTDVRVLVIQGHEHIFTAGNDIEDFLAHPPLEEDAPVFRFLKALSLFPKPIVASVCGPAVGIGSSMLLHCDLVVAGDNAAFSLPFVNLGLSPEGASSFLLPQLMGYHRACEALLLGDPFMAEAALEVGFVNKVVVPSEAREAAQAWAKRLEAKPLNALIQTKAILKSQQTAATSSSMKAEVALFAQLMSEGASKEAFKAFLEKRKPDFSQF